MEECEILASIHFNDCHMLPDCGSTGHTAVIGVFQHLTQLTHIELGYIDLGDDATLLVTPHMTRLQKVKLDEVKMSSRRWTEFVSSLLRVQHKVTVTLKFTNVDGDLVNIKHDLPNCTVIGERYTPSITRQGDYFYTLNFIAKHPTL